jgi:hypothetical protein
MLLSTTNKPVFMPKFRLTMDNAKRKGDEFVMKKKIYYLN